MCSLSMQVGGASEVEVGEKKDRITDALNATKVGRAGAQSWMDLQRCTCGAGAQLLDKSGWTCSAVPVAQRRSCLTAPDATRCALASPVHLRAAATCFVLLNAANCAVASPVCSPQAAVEEGIVPGGGTALVYASRTLESVKGKCENFDQKVRGRGVIC